MYWTRYNLKIPTETYKMLKKIAEQEKMTVADLLRRATKLLLFVRSITQASDARLLVERGSEVQEIVVDLI
jgi:predicted DNA-binding ribbon-helix-helix protein